MAMDLFNYFLSDLPGAPQLLRQPGSLIEVLDAALVTGIGLTVVNQITSVAGMVTVTLAGRPPALEGGLVEIRGASMSAFNGVHRVEAVGINTITAQISNAPDVTLTDPSVTMRIPPLGWEIAHSDTHRRIYRSLSVFSNGFFLYVDDNLPHVAVIEGVKQATDIDSRVSFGRTGFWRKAGGNNHADWCIVGDARAIYLGVSIDFSQRRNYAWHAFLDAHASDDSYSTMVFSLPGSGTLVSNLEELGEKNINHLTLAGDVEGGSSGVAVLVSGAADSGRSGGHGRLSYSPFSSISKRLWLYPVYVFSQGQYRGELPGLRFIPHNIFNGGREFLNKITRFPDGGRVLFLTAAVHTHWAGAAVAFDVDGWRG